MGVNCNIRLPHNVRVQDVVSVIGALAGCPKNQQFFGSRDGGWSTKVHGVGVYPTAIPGMCEIRIEHLKMVDGETVHTATYHFEPEFDGRLFYPKSTAFWIVIGRGLVDFFGGEIDYQDCDEVACNYKKKAKTRRKNSPTDGVEWYDLQNRILAIHPITEEEWKHCDKFAAYKTAVGPC